MSSTPRGRSGLLPAGRICWRHVGHPFCWRRPPHGKTWQTEEFFNRPGGRGMSKGAALRAALKGEVSLGAVWPWGRRRAGAYFDVGSVFDGLPRLFWICLLVMPLWRRWLKFVSRVCATISALW